MNLEKFASFDNPKTNGSMSFGTLATLATVTFYLLINPVFSQNDCPVLSKGETSSDCPWAKIARELLRDPNLVTESDFRFLAPTLSKSIDSDRKLSGMKSLWGTSINFDEIAKQEIVQPALLDTLGQMMGVQKRKDRLVHAGMEHIYGYLFSLVQTPFGYKRARWVKGEIEIGFGISNGLLGPTPSEGTLFSNLSYFVGQFAFRDLTAERSILKQDSSGVASEILNFDYTKIKTGELQETLQLQLGTPQTPNMRSVTLITQLARFKNIPTSKDENSLLLIYSVRDSSEKNAKLITAFPVNAGFANRLLVPNQMGGDQPISTRYNAHVDGITGNTGLKGTRKIITPLE